MALVAARVAAADEGGVPAVSEMAAAPESERADLLWVVLAWALVVGGALLGWGLYEWVEPEMFVPGVEISLFAPLYILAQGIERVLEPFTFAVGQVEGQTKAQAANARNAALASGDVGAAAANQALVNRIRRNRAVIIWGAASFLGMLACGAFGVRLLSAAKFDVPAFWDIAITGLAVGAGTKPLHDLISNIQKAKENREDPPAVQTTN